MNTTRLSLICLFVCLAGAALNVNAQSDCTNSKPKDLTVICKDRYFLGETPTITILMTNTGRSLKTVNDAEHQKFALEMTVFSNDRKPKKMKAVYDCCWAVPEQTDPNITYWYTPVKIATKYVTLRPGESTSVTVDLPRTFNTFMNVSKYTLALKFESGKKIVRKFEVYFDDEKSLPIFAKTIESDDHVQREWAVYTVAEFNRPALDRILEELAKSPNQKQREFANHYLTHLKTGVLDALRLHVDTQDRYSLNENPEIKISIENFTSAPEKVKEAQHQKFFLELRRLLPNQSEQEIKTCVYTPAESQPKPRLITLLERDQTSFMLNLQECFGSRLEAGSYELIVKPEIEPRMRDQTAARKFEIR